MTKVKSQTLSLAMPQPASPISSTVTSPSDPDSRAASPNHIQETGTLQHRAGNESTGIRDDSPNTYDTRNLQGSTLTSLPSVPQSPKNVPRHGQSRSLFGNLKAAKSSNKVNKLETTIRQVSADQPRDHTNGEVAGIYSLGKGPGSTPDLSLSTLTTSSLDILGGTSFEDIVRWVFLMLFHAQVIISLILLSGRWDLQSYRTRRSLPLRQAPPPQGRISLVLHNFLLALAQYGQMKGEAGDLNPQPLYRRQCKKTDSGLMKAMIVKALRPHR